MIKEKSDEFWELYSGTRNATMFIEIVEEVICDWISYHKQCQPKQNKIQVSYLTFDQDSTCIAVARSFDKSFKQYQFVVTGGGHNLCINVFDTSSNRQVTHRWNGYTFLCFDKNGCSYEVNAEEFEYLNPKYLIEDIKTIGLSN